jgi:nondiscriminating aspartyl-tRNA synthetase
MSPLQGFPLTGGLAGAIFYWPVAGRVKMERTLIRDLWGKAGQAVTICGWVHIQRDQGGIRFLVIRDITGLIQVVVLKKSSAFENAGKLTLESLVKINGLCKLEKQAPGGLEVQAETIEVLSLAEPNLPIQVVEKSGNEAELPIRLDWRFLDLRKPEKALVFKVWTAMEQAFRHYCISNGYIEIHSPKTVVTSTESGSELFEIKYFGRTAYLAQSPQLYKQMAMTAGFEKVFEVGPVFRANPSFTSRHDTEFTMYDIEMSFINSHHDLMAEEERLITSMMGSIKEQYGEAIMQAYGQGVIVPTHPFPRLTLCEAKSILSGLGIKSEKHDDMSPEEERAICQYVKEKYAHEFVFIHEFPASGRAFYTMKLESDPTLTKSFDLLFKGIEITSGAQREHRHEILKNQIQEKGFKLEPFESYLNFFRYGCPPHGGFAPGPSRILMQIFGASTVREVTYIYRGVNRLTP